MQTVAIADVNVSDDTWVLRNMMRDVSNQTARELGLHNDTCDWNFVTCNKDNRVTALELEFEPVAGDYINTTYWPLMTENISLDISWDSNISLGSLILDNLPRTIQIFDITGSGFHLDLTTFPNISHLNNLRELKIGLYDFIGVATDLGSKLPQNLQFLRLWRFVMDKFPNFAKLTKLRYLRIYDGNIANDNGSFVSSTLPPNLEYLILYTMYGLTGELHFSSLMPHSPNLTYIYLDPQGDSTFQSVDFRGINDDTYVFLPRSIGCKAIEDDICLSTL